MSRSRIRTRLPAFITGGGQPQPNRQSRATGRTATSRATARIVSGIVGAGVIAAAVIRPERPDNFGNVNPQGAAPQPIPGDGGDEPRQPD